jgi:hypothetical protein
VGDETVVFEGPQQLIKPFGVLLMAAMHKDFMAFEISFFQ